MGREDGIDYFLVAHEHLVIHERLINWARYVTPGRAHHTGPIWKLGKSNGRQWEQPILSTPIDTQDGHKLEKAGASLPDKHRDAVRWAYVRRTVLPHKVRRELGVTAQGLMDLIRNGRQMLVNRGT